MELRTEEDASEEVQDQVAEPKAPLAQVSSSSKEAPSEPPDSPGSHDSDDDVVTDCRQQSSEPEQSVPPEPAQQTEKPRTSVFDRLYSDASHRKHHKVYPAEAIGVMVVVEDSAHQPGEEAGSKPKKKVTLAVGDLEGNKSATPRHHTSKKKPGDVSDTEETTKKSRMSVYDRLYHNVTPAPRPRPSKEDDEEDDDDDDVDVAEEEEERSTSTRMSVYDRLYHNVGRSNARNPPRRPIKEDKSKKKGKKGKKKDRDHLLDGSHLEHHRDENARNVGHESRSSKVGGSGAGKEGDGGDGDEDEDEEDQEEGQGSRTSSGKPAKRTSLGNIGTRALLLQQQALARRAAQQQQLQMLFAPKDSEDDKEEEVVLDASLVERHSVMRGAIPVMPVPLAYLCLFLNVLVPGLGTVTSGLLCLCFGKARFTEHDRFATRFGSLCVNLITGSMQLFTVLFCLVGWGWSIGWGVIMLRVAWKHRELKKTATRRGKRRPPYGFPPPINNSWGLAANNVSAVAAVAAAAAPHPPAQAS